ncbi:MAG: hypothetical protein WBW01_08445, partial [Terriglobales bacterium]
QMLRKKIAKTISVRPVLSTVVLASAALLGATASSQTMLGQTAPGQAKTIVPRAVALLDLPIVMQQKVAAGKTLVGTKVQAKLAVATLLNGVVLPEDAILTGEVIESVAKSATNPSILGIRMDSAQWANGVAHIRAYLTAWYYPLVTTPDEDPTPDSPYAATNLKHWNGPAYIPDSSIRLPQPVPNRNSEEDKGPTAPPTAAPVSSISKRRTLMKDIQTTSHSDGALALTSKQSTIKLDKTTIYMLVAGVAQSAK